MQEVRAVLIVDDSRVQRKILATQLARAGFQVSEAGSGEEAMAHCRAELPDIIISDWVMTGMSGIDLCREVRAISDERYVYFILLTSKTESAEVALGLDQGADDFLTKPITGDELRARITAGQRILTIQGELRAKNRLLSATLGTLQKIHEAIDRDLVEARKLQQSLVRERQRSFGNAEVNLVLRPSGQIGGDLVGFFPINGSRVGFYAIDVSGHGITSALMTARLAGYLSGSTPDQNIALIQTLAGGYDAVPPADLAAALNRIVQAEMQTESYFTLAYADVDLTSGRVALVQAGHPHPAILRANGQVDLLGDGGLPIGLFPDATYETVRARLFPGDRLILISDGVIEADLRDGTQLGDTGFARLLQGCRHLTGAGFAEALMARLTDLVGADFGDDVSGVFLDYDDPGSTASAAFAGVI